MVRCSIVSASKVRKNCNSTYQNQDQNIVLRTAITAGTYARMYPKIQFGSITKATADSCWASKIGKRKSQKWVVKTNSCILIGCMSLILLQDQNDTEEVPRSTKTWVHMICKTRRIAEVTHKRCKHTQSMWQPVQVTLQLQHTIMPKRPCSTIHDDMIG